MDYDSKYSKPELYWGLEPNELLVNSIQYLPTHGKVLDLGCGEGRNSFFLAKNGFEVIAVDISDEGIKKVNDFAKKKSLNIASYVYDAKSYLADCGLFDAIYAMHVLQFIHDGNILHLVKCIQSKTKSKGVNVIISDVAKNSKQKDLLLSQGRYFFDEGELRELYKDWKIIYYEEKLGDWETHGEPKHRHFYVKLIAQKL